MGNLRDFCVNLCSRQRMTRRISPLTPSDDVSNGKTSQQSRSQSRRRVNAAPPALYSRAGEAARRALPAALACAAFCGGARCRYECPDGWRPDQIAVQGVFSNWITDDILAMARPSTNAIAARNIIEQFHSWGIRTVVNLQTAGEHASCGPPLQTSGFTYEPSIFMDNDIFFYNYAWSDYGDATLSNLLDMVKVVAFSVAQGRVAVHCHAGLGRTGVLVACYLVHSLRIKANDAIRLVRRKRPGAVQTSGQILCVQQFEHYILPQTVVFSSRDMSQTKERKSCVFNLKQHLYRQKAVLHGLDERVFKYLPKIVYCICERLLKISNCDAVLDLDYSVKMLPFTRSFLAFRMKQPSDDEVPSPAVTPRERPEQGCLSIVEWKNPLEDDKDDGKIVIPSKPAAPANRAISKPKTSFLNANHICQAILIDHSAMPDHRRRYMRQLQMDINHRVSAFERIDVEEDPQILSGLLLEWLEGLKAPVLDQQDLSIIVARGEKVESCIRKLELEDVILLEYLVRFVARLRPLPASRKVDVLKRFLASLTHQTVTIDDLTLPSSKDFAKLRDGTSTNTLNFFIRLLLEVHKDASKSGSDDKDVIVASNKVKSAKPKFVRKCC